MLGLMAAASPVLQLGLLHMRPIQLWLKQRVPSVAWSHGRNRVTVTWACESVLARGPPLAKARRDLRNGAQKEGCHDRRFQQGLGSAVWRQTDLQSFVRRGVGPAHQLPKMLAVCHACYFFLPDIRGHHVLVRSDSRSVVSYINHQGSLASKCLCMLANDLLV